MASNFSSGFNSGSVDDTESKQLDIECNNLTTWKKFRVGGYTDNRLLKKSSKHYESTGQLQPGEYGHDDTGMYKILSLNICKRRFTDFAKRYDTVPEIFQKAVNTENNGPVTLKFFEDIDGSRNGLDDESVDYFNRKTKSRLFNHSSGYWSQDPMKMPNLGPRVHFRSSSSIDMEFEQGGDPNGPSGPIGPDLVDDDEIDVTDNSDDSGCDDEDEKERSSPEDIDLLSGLLDVMDDLRSANPNTTSVRPDFLSSLPSSSDTQNQWTQKVLGKLCSQKQLRILNCGRTIYLDSGGNPFRILMIAMRKHVVKDSGEPIRLAGDIILCGITYPVGPDSYIPFCQCRNSVVTIDTIINGSQKHGTNVECDHIPILHALNHVTQSKSPQNMYELLLQIHNPLDLLIQANITGSVDYQHLGEFSMPAMYPSPFGNSQYSNNDFESGLQEDEQDYFQLVLVDGSFGVISCQTGRCSICGAYQCLHCRAAKQNKLNLSGSNSREKFMHQHRSFDPVHGDFDAFDKLKVKSATRAYLECENNRPAIDEYLRNLRVHQDRSSKLRTLNIRHQLLPSNVLFEDINVSRLNVKCPDSKCTFCNNLELIRKPVLVFDEHGPYFDAWIETVQCRGCRTFFYPSGTSQGLFHVGDSESYVTVEVFNSLFTKRKGRSCISFYHNFYSMAEVYLNSIKGPDVTVHSLCVQTLGREFNGPFGDFRSTILHAVSNLIAARFMCNLNYAFAEFLELQYPNVNECFYHDQGLGCDHDYAAYLADGTAAAYGPKNGKFMSRPRNGSLGKFKSCDVEHRILIRRNGDTEKLLNIFYRYVNKGVKETELEMALQAIRDSHPASVNNDNSSTSSSYANPIPATTFSAMSKLAQSTFLFRACLFLFQAPFRKSRNNRNNESIVSAPKYIRSLIKAVLSQSPPINFVPESVMTQLMVFGEELVEKCRQLPVNAYVTLASLGSYRELCQNADITIIIPFVNSVGGQKLLDLPFAEHFLKFIQMLQGVVSAFISNPGSYSVCLLSECLRTPSIRRSAPLFFLITVADFLIDTILSHALGEFFPELTAVRDIPEYVIDKYNPNGSKSCSTQEHCGECNKYFTDKNVLFIIICTTCRKVVGFKMLSESESPRIIFEIFFRYFKRAPKQIIYDAACRAHLYCVLREYQFFKDTHFIIDRFHAYNHVESCSPAYNPRMVDRETNRLISVNTSQAESTNSYVKQLASHVKYMRPSLGFFFLRHHLAILNMEKSVMNAIKLQTVNN